MATAGEDRSDGWRPRRRSLGGMLSVAARVFAAAHHARLDAAGLGDLRPGSGNLFEHIGEGGSTVAAMAVRAGITPQAMVQVVDQLEERGYVARVPDPRDRRAKLVQVTDEGRRVDRIARASLDAVEAEWASLLGEGRFDALRDALVDLLAALERSGEGRAGDVTPDR